MPDRPPADKGLDAPAKDRETVRKIPGTVRKRQNHMSDEAVKLDKLRDTILSRPDVILNDHAIMRALIADDDRARGDNIVDLRGIAMERLENRLGQLEDTHRSVIAAAYDNLAGTNQVHRAVLALLEPEDFEGFLDCLDGEVAAILRIDHIRLVLESATRSGGNTPEPPSDRVLSFVEPGFVERHLSAGRGTAPRRQITLRQPPEDDETLYSGTAGPIGSEALMRLDFGPRHLPGLLAFGSADPQQFHPGQATDLLAFFASVFERQMRRWLS